MSANLWDDQTGATAGAANFAILNLLYLLIDKKIISNEEAAGVFTKTANQVRDGSEDGSNPMAGEQVAKMMEMMAGWCLGQNPKL